MSNTDMVRAHKANNPKVTTLFTRSVWKAMGSNKNGWVETDGTTLPPNTANAKNEATTEAEYRKLTEQAKGFAKDGKNAEALAKYKAAQELKDSPYLKGVVNKLQETVDAEANRAELVASGDAAMTANDYETALDFYGQAQELSETDEVAAKIADAKAKEEESLTN